MKPSTVLKKKPPELLGSALVTRYQQSDNHEPRINCDMPWLLVLHYTGMANGPAAVDWLCNPASKVSCHYLVDVDGSIVQMVGEDRRAWHAGVSNWQGVVDINSASIGIEIQNVGHSGGLPTFPVVQLQAVAALCLDIMSRYALLPENVVAHSDIAPGRKVDPGEAFDWGYLAKCGIGQSICAGPHLCGSVLTFQQMLIACGYGLEASGEFDQRTRIVTEAVQRRYRRLRVDGKLDDETFDIVRRLYAITRPHAEINFCSGPHIV
jgi:N-acetylmuramoyl-L-alanine amidase